MGVGWAIAIALVASPIAAQTTSQIDGWTVGPTGESCIMLMEYDGEGATNLFVQLNADDEIYMGITNYNWTIAEDKEVKLSYRMSIGDYNDRFAVGIAPSGRKGFLSAFGPAFLDEISKSTYLHIYSGEVLVDRLGLTGSAGAVTRLRSCAAKVKAKVLAERREKARFADIPKDPFAVSRPVLPVVPRGMLVTQDDYPAAALRERRGGRVVVKYTVNTSGKAESCFVLESSGSDDLDTTTCRLIERRGRFTPATDAQGNKITSSGSETVVWTLPAQ